MEGGWLPTGVGKGAWWLPAGGIRASQGTFSSLTNSTIDSMPFYTISKVLTNAVVNIIVLRNRSPKPCL